MEFYSTEDINVGDKIMIKYNGAVINKGDIVTSKNNYDIDGSVEANTNTKSKSTAQGFKIMYVYITRYYACDVRDVVYQLYLCGFASYNFGVGS